MNIDMTTANTAIKRTRHVIPTVEEFRYELNGAKLFTKLDMKHGYMQMELNPKSRPITTFYTHRGLRRSSRLMFGINSAAEVFHKEIHQTIADIPGVRNIYDGILVHGKTVEEHNLALIAVSQRLQDCGLTLNINKCIFFQPKIEFFGVVFSAEGVEPTEDRVAALLSTPRPTTIVEVKSFLRMANFSSYFIPDFSNKTVPLRTMTKKVQNSIGQLSVRMLLMTSNKHYAKHLSWRTSTQTKKTKLIVDGSKKT